MESIQITWGQLGVFTAAFIAFMGWFFKLLKSELKDMRKEMVEIRKESNDNYKRLDEKVEHVGDKVSSVENRLTAIETILPYITPSKRFHFQEVSDEAKEN